jgi:DNA repair protein RecN (Recombination protein N)
MSEQHQIISITHLPQIAAQADRHLFVYKDDTKLVTVARIKALDQAEKVLEIAKMLSGDQPGEAAMLTARELIGPSLN